MNDGKRIDEPTFSGTVCRCVVCEKVIERGAPVHRVKVGANRVGPICSLNCCLDACDMVNNYREKVEEEEEDAEPEPPSIPAYPQRRPSVGADIVVGRLVDGGYLIRRCRYKFGLFLVHGDDGIFRGDLMPSPGDYWISDKFRHNGRDATAVMRDHMERITEG